MRWAVFHGSPRARKSNSALMMEHFRAGFEQAGGEGWDEHFLAQTRKRAQHLAAFAAAERVLVVFPLYVDAMPTQVMAFFEALQGRVGRDDNPPLAFLVHCGFPESLHLRPIERYLEKLARRLGSEYLGTMVKGGSEGIQVMPPLMTSKLFETMRQLGRDSASPGPLDPALLRRLAGRERFRGVPKLALRLMQATGLTDRYWNQQLRENEVWEQRFARPYAP